MFAAPAGADSASGGSNPYDGQDPAATGCNQNAALIATSPITSRETGQQVATIEVYYSYSCETNWLRVDANPYGGSANKNIFSDAGGWNSESDEGAGSSYSMMVYAPGDTSINGEVYLFEPGVQEWNWKAEGAFTI